MNVAGGTLAIHSKIAALGIVLLPVVAVDARAQDAITVAVGGRGIGASCVTQIGGTSGLLGAFTLYSKGAPVRIIGASYAGGRQVSWYVPASSSIPRPQEL